MLTSNVSATDFTAYSATVVYALDDTIQFDTTDFHHNYKSLTGSRSTVTMTVAAPCVVTWIGHGRAANDPISFTTTGALPTGLVANTTYYVKTPTTDTFNVSATAGGVAIATTGTQSGVHTATSSLNFNKSPDTSPTVWLDTGATNKWKAFDKSVQSQTTNTSTIVETIATTGRVNSVALMNIACATAHITSTAPGEGTIYDRTVSMVRTDGIDNWYNYYFEQIVRDTDKVLTDLPVHANQTITVTLTDVGNTVALGALVVGQSIDISSDKKGVEFGAKVGIQDYSVKTKDAFGNYTITERAFNKRADFTVWVDTSNVAAIQNLLSSYRATPVVYIGGELTDATTIYGFYKDYNIEVAYSTSSVVTIQIEGLT